MAKLYGEILSSALMTFDKSFARANGQPLDSTEVYYSLAAAQEYAAGAGAYVGQKIVVVENGVVTHYGIENEAGALKELGSKPVGDNNSIVVAEDGTISLKGIGTLVFERELEDGTKEAIQYQPLMTDAGLVWVEPSKTTVEGLATLIEGLNTRVKAIEDDYLKAADIADMATDAEVEAAIKVESDRALAAEEALGGRSDDVDGKFANYVTTESFGTFKTENTQAIADAKSGAETTAANALAAARTEISKEIDDDVKVAKDRADEAYELAGTKLDASAYEADMLVLNASVESVGDMAEATKARVDAFLDTEGVADVVDSLKDIKAELEALGDAVDLEEQFAAKADKTVVEGIEGRVKAIEDAPYVTKSQLDDVDGKFASYTNTETLTGLLAGKQDVIPENTYDAYGAAATAKSEAIADAEGKIATAKSEAIDEAASAAAALYATLTQVSELETELDGRLDALEAIDHTAYATNEVFNEYKTTVENTYATKTTVQEISQVANNAATKVETLEDKIEEITEVGGEPNVIDYIKVNGTILEVEKDAEGKSTKTVNIAVPTKFSDITDDSGFDARIAAALKAGTDAQSTADSAVSAASQAQADVDALENTVGTLQTTVAGHTTSISDYATRIGVLEQADTTHATEYNELKTIVSGHTKSIAKKADTSALNDAVAKISANEEAIKTLNETTIPGINDAIALKADASALGSYYKKTEIDAITGEVAADKTLVQMISEAQTAATYDDAEVRGLITAEAGRAAKAEKANADEIARVNGVLVAALENDAEGLDSIKESADWINTHGTEADNMAKAITANTGAIAAINHETTGILATAKGYTDSAIAGLPAATADALGLVKYDNSTIKMNDNNQLYVAKVSTDILAQGTQTLILNGGSANA